MHAKSSHKDSLMKDSGLPSPLAKEVNASQVVTGASTVRAPRPPRPSAEDMRKCGLKPTRALSREGDELSSIACDDEGGSTAPMSESALGAIGAGADEVQRTSGVRGKAGARSFQSLSESFGQEAADSTGAVAW